MFAEHGPIVAALASFELGLIASVTPSVYRLIPRTLWQLDPTGGCSGGRRAALAATFMLGLAALFVPLGLVSGLTGGVMGWITWQPIVVGGLALVCVGLAASMFGAFELRLPSSLRTKLEAVGGVGGFRSAFATGLLTGLMAAPTTLPFALGLSTILVLSGKAWLGAAALCSFGLGLGTVFFVANTRAMSMPKLGAWTTGMKWICGVGFAYLAFAHVRDRFYSVGVFVKDASYWLGLIAGAVFLVGIVLGGLHVLAEVAGSKIAHLSRRLKLASIAPAAVGCALFLSWAPHPHGWAPPVTWLTDEAQGRALATAEHKPVVIVFNATWCCKEVERDMFPDPRVREEALRFVTIAIDASDYDQHETQRLQDKYKVVGLPTIVLLDGAGNESTRIQSFVSPESLASMMRNVPP